MIAPTTNISAATVWISCSGRNETTLPTPTATPVCTRKASATPIQTKSGRIFVDITKVAMNVLSGSSTTKMAPKASATTRGSITG